MASPYSLYIRGKNEGTLFERGGAKKEGVEDALVETRRKESSELKRIDHERIQGVHDRLQNRGFGNYLQREGGGRAWEEALKPLRDQSQWKTKKRMRRALWRIWEGGVN